VIGEHPLHTLRIFIGLAVGLLACAVVAPSPLDLGSGSAHAQELAAVKKKKVKKQEPRRREPRKQEQERAPFTAEDQNAAVIPGIPDARIWGDSATDFPRVVPQAKGPWLAISGGGSDGAYGAGLLIGWSQSGKRPEFAMLTGVSIGSLIAPFAFLGPDHDEDLRKNFTTVTAADIFEDRITRESLFDYWPLRRMIEERVTEKLLAEIAAEHRRGRRLLVATTNLDAGRRVIWNMGAIAERGDEKALKLFRDILLASCSIPGFFAPVAIEVEANGKKFQELHGDGTITSPFFVMPEALLFASAATPPPMSELYLIVNSKFRSEFKMTDRTIAGVLGRSIDLALTAALRTQVVLMSAVAQRSGIALRVANVPAAFDFPSRGPFDGKFMKALFEFGLEQGKKGAPFSDTLPELSLHRSNVAQ
jgi:predicted acylesterase/phospholipase RssA